MGGTGMNGSGLAPHESGSCMSLHPKEMPGIASHSTRTGLETHKHNLNHPGRGARRCWRASPRRWQSACLRTRWSPTTPWASPPRGSRGPLPRPCTAAACVRPSALSPWARTTSARGRRRRAACPRTSHGASRPWTPWVGCFGGGGGGRGATCSGVVLRNICSVVYPCCAPALHRVTLAVEHTTNPR